MPMRAAAGSGDAVEILMLGHAARFAGGCSTDKAQGAMFEACGDAIGDVPSKRWVIEEMVDMKQLAPVQQTAILHGAFVNGAEMFDGGVFNISAAEAGAMDPQQRLLLEAVRGSQPKS